MIIDKKIKYYLILLLLLFSSLFCFSFQLELIPYQGPYKKIVTEHFVILFPKDYADTAKKTALYAEDIHENLSPILNWAPYEKTTIVITDHTDYPNGMALPFIRNSIYLYVSPVELTKTLRDFRDPLYSLILHEYTHILHIDQIRGAAWFWRVLYGKSYFPVTGSFRWYLEGTAVLMETKLSPGGRLNSSYNDALVRTAAKQKKLPSFDTLIFPEIVDWPHGKGIYHFGAKFIEYIYDTYGKEKYNEFIIDISDDFWPFVLLFVMKFEKIYGKSLKELWLEWIKYEEKIAEGYPEPEVISEQITNLEGSIDSLDIKDNKLLISSNSYKNDIYLYLYENNKLKKIHIGSHRSVTFTNDNKYVVYTRGVDYPNGFTRFEAFSLNMETKIERKLTTKKRINYVSFAKNSPVGILVGHSGHGSNLYKAQFKNGKIYEIEELNVPSYIKFIDQPSINDSGTKAVFSAHLENGIYRIFILDILSNEIKILDENIIGQRVKWINENKISFIAPDGESDSLYSVSLNDLKTNKLVNSYGSILNGIVFGEEVYYVDYTLTGEELFITKIQEKKSSIDDSMYELEKETLNIKDLKYDLEIKRYAGFKNFIPTMWALLPFQLRSIAYIGLSNGGIAIPFFGPQLMIYNSMPLGRFHYNFRIGLDYMKMYPENSLSLSFKLPYINISYLWQNWAGGEKHLINGKIVEQKIYIANPVIYNIYPINFSNSLSLDYLISLANFGKLQWAVSFNHRYQQFDFDLNRFSNTISFSEVVSYYYIKSRRKASRWDRGILINLNAKQTPHNILDNQPSYILRGLIKGRVPFFNMVFFMNIEGGVEALFQNVFSANTELYQFSEGVIGNSSSTLGTNIIDTKAFSSSIVTSSNGSAFIAADIGFDITIYKRSHYWHFATLGFREFYIKNYFEFVYLYNEKNTLTPQKGILFDTALELCVDLFVAYGNINVGFVLGGAIGYRIGDMLPAWGVFSYFSAGL